MAQRRLNLNVGINPTGYLGAGWKYRTGTHRDIADPAYYLRLARIAHRGVFDAVFVSDMPQLPLGDVSFARRQLCPTSASKAGISILQAPRAASRGPDGSRRHCAAARRPTAAPSP